jgi:hypothetical protein
MSYDPRAVKISKSVKRVAATMTDKEQRRSFIKGYVRAETANAHQSMSRKRDKAQ